MNRRIFLKLLGISPIVPSVLMATTPLLRKDITTEYLIEWGNDKVHAITPRLTLLERAEQDQDCHALLDIVDIMSEKNEIIKGMHELT